MNKNIVILLFLLIMTSNLAGILCREYKIDIGKGYEKTYEVTKALDAEFFGEKVKKGDTIKVKVKDIIESEVLGDKYKIPVGDVYVNKKKVLENATLLYPSTEFFIYPDKTWIDKYLKPGFEAIEADITVEDDGKHVKVSYTMEVDIYTYKRVYEWRDGVLIYYYARLEVAGDVLSELEFGKSEIPIWWWLLPLIVIAAIIVIFVWRKIKSR